MISMYKIIKEMGASENVYLQNTDTMAEINLGRITPTMCRILEKDGYSCGDMYAGTAISFKEKWTLKVSDEVKDELRKLAMPMKKPIRSKVNSETTTNKKKEIKQPVDVLDIIYGLA